VKYEIRLSHRAERDPDRLDKPWQKPTMRRLEQLACATAVFAAIAHRPTTTNSTTDAESESGSGSASSGTIARKHCCDGFHSVILALTDGNDEWAKAHFFIGRRFCSDESQ
jgi:hypothetical protein